ncbi:MAG: LamG-like jellyroll fold domain-containing protein [Planctomycetota bacterium]|jgi:lysophospholipase L1-like esterase
MALAVCADAGARDISLLPLGDSITDGGAYRRALWKMLIDDGYRVEFMGACRNGKAEEYKGQVWDGDHESVWGISSQWLLAKLKVDLPRTREAHGGRKVEFALYHIGTNDINTGDRAHGEKAVTTRTIVYMEETIDVLRQHNPNITVLVCKILPIKNSQTVRMGLVDFLNERIEELAARKTTPRSPVVVVDQNTGFDATRGVDTYDGMHPNEQGGRKMAARFFKAIKRCLAARVQTILVDPETLVVPENGEATLRVRFSKEIPRGRGLTVNTSVGAGDRDIRVARGARLSFDSTNWDRAQEVVLRAAEDADDRSGEVAVRLESAPPVEVLTVRAVEQDDDYTGPRPILWWKLDGKAADVADSSNHGRRGKAYGKLTRGMPGRIGKAFRLEGNAYIRIGAAAGDARNALDFSGRQMTLAAWIRPVSHGNGRWQGIFGASDWHAPCLSLKNDGWLLFGIVGAADPVNGGKIPLGRWTHVAVTFDDAASRLQYFVNGRAVGAATAYGARIRKGKTVEYVGKRAWEDQHYFNGMIDDVRVYGQILSDRTVRDIYNESSAAAADERGSTQAGRKTR